jgi:hypothetical protein
MTYMHSDHLGSVTTTTNQNGGVVSSQQFDPWGKVRTGGISVTKLNYTGQRKDDTGLLYSCYKNALDLLDSIDMGTGVIHSGFGICFVLASTTRNQTLGWGRMPPHGAPTALPLFTGSAKYTPGTSKVCFII